MKTGKGYTLIELMITMVALNLIITVVYAVHTSQQNVYNTQEQVAEMQQNLRAAMYFITSDIRMAGYDPLGSADAGIEWALPGRLRLMADINNDGDLVDGERGDRKETIDIGFSTTHDAAGDGIPDSDYDSDGFMDAVSIGRQYNKAGGYKAFADNIQALEFLYFDSAGTVTEIIDDIRSVQVTVLAKAGRLDRKFMNTSTYTTPSGQTWGPYNDNFRRRMLTSTIRCRNLGL